MRPGLQMSKCSVKFVPVLFAGVVAGTNLATVTDLRAQATERTEAATMQVAQVADNCLTAPSGATPSGSHWYYRIDRVTKRQCWYLREESEKADDRFARAAPPESAPASPPSADASRTKKFNEARAEYIAQQSRAEPVRAETRSIAAPAAPVVQASERAAMPNVMAPSPLSGVRWNEVPAAASTSSNPAPVQVAAATTPVAEQAPRSDYVQQPSAEQVAAAAAEPAKPTASFQMLLIVMAAALALAGLTVSAMVRIGRMRARRAMRRKRRAMWDSARDKKRAPQPAFQDEGAKLRRAAASMQPARAPRDKTFQERSFQERNFQERNFQDRPFQERTTRVPRERPAPERSYAPPERRAVPQQREREQQVTEMLARLARSAQT